MKRCVHFYGTDKQCKNPGTPYCKVHRNTNKSKCTVCKKIRLDVPKVTLQICRDAMCIDCCVNTIRDVQFFDGFGTCDPLFCPVCCQELSKNNWYTVIDVLVKLKYIQPEIIFNNDPYNSYRVVYNKYSAPYQVDTSHRIQLDNRNIYI